MALISESVVEDAALDWFRVLGYDVVGGPDMPLGPGALRMSYKNALFAPILHGALGRLNPSLPIEALDDAFHKLTHPEGANLEDRNRSFHCMIVNGVTVDYQDDNSTTRSTQIRVLDFDDPLGNDWLAVNQFTVIENSHIGRPDIVLFINGMPLGLIEIKNLEDEGAAIWTALRQIQTYKVELTSLFSMNAVLIVSDGIAARIGSLTSGCECFKPWRMITGEELAPSFYPDLRVLIEGVFEKRRFLSLIHNYIVFKNEGSGKLSKNIASYHQFHAVETAVRETLSAADLRQNIDFVEESGCRAGGKVGDRRIGIVWHTQGSGKSMTMAFYAGCIIRKPAMETPTVIVLTNSNDIDDKLFSTFTRCSDLFQQPPLLARSRADLRIKLADESGGVVFTTIQKLIPEGKLKSHMVMSERRNIVVIADGVHCSQYDLIDDFACHMHDTLPNASFIGFTSTPIELKNTSISSLFGNYISIYDIQRAVEDGANLLREPVS